MAFAFEWDPAKAAINLAKHRVSFDEASTVFADPLSSTFPDPGHSLGEERLVIIFSAREATRAERTAYEEGNR